MYKTLWGFCYVGLFAHFFFEEYCSAPFGRHHDTMFESIARGVRGRQVNVLAPRGSSKSTCMAVIYPLHCVFYKEFYESLGMEADHFILVISKSETMALARVRDIMRKCELDPRFKWLREGSSLWGAKALEMSNGVLIRPVGRGGQVRGSLYGAHRPSLIITDDLDDPETVTNPDVRAKDQLWFDTDLLRAGSLDGQTNFLNIDTVKHEESVANLLRNRTGWRNKFYQAIQHPADLWHPTAEHLWKEWSAIYTDMSISDEDRERLAAQFLDENRVEMMDGVEHLWEEVISYEDIRKEICDMGYFPVLRELQNSVRDPSRAIFDMDNAVRFKVTSDGLLRSDGRLVAWSQLVGGSVFLDWAGGKDAVDNCFACAVCVAWEPMPGGRRDNAASLAGCHAYVLCVWMDKVKLSLQVNSALDTYEAGKAMISSSGELQWRFSVEDFIESADSLKDYVQMTFREAKERRHLDVALEFTKRFTNKVERIAALEPAVTHGWLAFHENLPPGYIKQMSLFPTDDFMDAPDATEGACQLRITRSVAERRQLRESRPAQAQVRL